MYLPVFLSNYTFHYMQKVIDLDSDLLAQYYAVINVISLSATLALLTSSELTPSYPHEIWKHQPQSR